MRLDASLTSQALPIAEAVAARMVEDTQVQRQVEVTRARLAALRGD